MLKFILRTLLGVPGWLLYMAIQLPLMLIGVPLVALLALWVQLRFKYVNHLRPGDGLLHFPAPFGLRLFYLWDNDEDGIDGDPWTEAGGEPKNPAWFEATATWPVWRKVFVWSAWRNSVGNARRFPFLGMTIKDPKDLVVYLPQAVKDTLPWNKPPATMVWSDYRKLGPYLARYGWRFELKFPWNRCPGCKNTVECTAQTTRYFWIGWRIAQQDTPNTSVAFAFQPWAKL